VQQTAWQAWQLEHWGHCCCCLCWHLAAGVLPLLLLRRQLRLPAAVCAALRV